MQPRRVGLDWAYGLFLVVMVGLTYLAPTGRAMPLKVFLGRG